MKLEKISEIASCPMKTFCDLTESDRERIVEYISETQSNDEKYTLLEVYQNEDYYLVHAYYKKKPDLNTYERIEMINVGK